MAHAEIERLKSDLATDPALQARLGAALTQNVDAPAAAALFQAAGYEITLTDLQPGGAVPLSEDELMAVTGGSGDRRMENGQIVGGGPSMNDISKMLGWLGLPPIVRGPPPF